MKKLIIIFFFFTLLYHESFTQDLLNKSVARVGNLKISDQEFLERYEMTPGFNRQRKNSTESNKIEFLFTLVAEKLWAIEALNRNLDTTEAIKFSTKAFEKMFVRDALFKKEIRDKIIITDQELSAGLVKNSTKLYVNFLFSEDAEEINSLYNLINDGVPFDSILAESPEKEEQISPMEIVFGQMDESVEDILYNLKIGENTKSILTPDGWYIFKLVNRSAELLMNEKDKEDAVKNVKKIIEARKLIDKQQEFYAKFFRNKKVDVNPQIFESLAKEISTIFEKEKKSLAIADSELIYLSIEDVSKIKSDFGNAILSENFIKLEKDPITTREYLNSLIFDGFNSKDYKINIIRASLDQRVQRDIEKELLYREGFAREYNKLPEVKRDVELWREHYLFEMIKDQFRDSVNVTENEVFKYYQQNNKPESYPMLVNVVEILTDSVGKAVKILNELNSGEDVKALAKKYNKRAWTKKSDGEYGLFPITQYGEIGRIASTMNVGDVYGPLKLKEGYSVFKLIDKQKEKFIPPQPFERFKDQYKQDLIFQKLYKRMTDFTYSLAVKYGVSLDLINLKDIKVTSIPSFGIRYLGFGGKINAAPLIAPNVDWADKWIQYQQEQKVIP
jgi:parvulin-like peptidyl-prolyl isomerase